MKEQLESQQINSLISNTNHPTVTFYFKKYDKDEPRRYNVPKVGEISAIFTSEIGDPPTDINFKIYSKQESNEDTYGVHTISFLSPHCDPMVYPLLFPYGEQGWRIGSKHEENK